MTKANFNRVSFPDEKLIVVDENDRILGFKTKEECHRGEGILHRAFSIFIFDDKNRLLIQRRSPQKHLWPLFWSNSCCSHPREGESYETATLRRLQEELGFKTPLKYLYKFTYHARFGEIGSERELCSVYIGRYVQQVHPNPNEIAEWKFVSVGELEADMNRRPQDYTPWFKMEWERLRSEFWDQIEKLGASSD